MPITFEAPAPIAAIGSVYEQAARIAAQQRNAQLAAAANQGGGGGGGGGGYGHAPLDSGIQDAINHRDQLQFQSAATAEARGPSERDNFFAQQAQAQAAQHFQLEAQLSQTQLTQAENMRLARMKNAVGDVSSDPSLSAEEKNDMILQLKTGIDPLARRQAAAKLAMDNQLKEQHAQMFQFQAAAEKSKLDALGKSPADRSGFVPDPRHLSDIAADLSSKIPMVPGMPPEGRDHIIATLAKQEAMRQGLGSHVLTHADGTETIISGPGSAAEKSSGKGKGGGVDHPTGLGPMDYMKLHAEAMKEADLEQKATTEGDIPGTKKQVNPQDSKWKYDRTKQIFQDKLDALKAYNDQAAPKKGGYDPSKAAWNQGRPAAAATPAATPAGDGVQSPKPLPVEMSNKIANEKANEVLQRNDLPQNVKIQAGEKYGVMRRLYEKVGGDLSKLTDAEKAQMQEANDYLKANVPQAGAGPDGAGSAPASPQQGGPSSAAVLGHLWDGQVAGLKSLVPDQISRGASEFGKQIKGVNFDEAKREFNQVGENINNGPVGRFFRGMNRNKLRAGER